MNETEALAICEGLIGKVVFTNKYDLGECVGLYNKYLQLIIGDPYVIKGVQWARELLDKNNARPDLVQQIHGKDGMLPGDCAVWDERIGKGGHVAVYAGGLDFYMQNWGGRKVRRITCTQDQFDLIIGYVRVLTINREQKPVEVPQKRHEVVSGDTLWDLGNTYGVDWHSIYEANKDIIGDDPDLIYPGQVFVIPEA